MKILKAALLATFGSTAPRSVISAEDVYTFAGDDSESHGRRIRIRGEATIDASMSASMSLPSTDFMTMLNEQSTTEVGGEFYISAKASKKSQIELLIEQVKVLTAGLNELTAKNKELTESLDLHPANATCAESTSRIDTLASKMPDGCMLAPFGQGQYRLVCDKPGVHFLHLPDMCNATAVLVAGGGAGGNSPDRRQEYGGFILSGGGGAGGIILIENTSFGDGYYVVEVGNGGVAQSEYY
jgi:hypothetical protein